MANGLSIAGGNGLNIPQMSNTQYQELIENGEVTVSVKNEEGIEEEVVVQITEQDKADYEGVLNHVSELGMGLDSSVDTSSVTDIGSAIAAMNKLKANINVYTNQLSYLNSQVASKNKELEDRKKELEKAVEKYEKIEAQFEAKEKEQEEVQNKIDEINKQIAKQTAIIKKGEDPEAMEEAYSKLSELYTNVSSLYSTKSDIQGEMSDLSSQLTAQQGVVDKLQMSVNSLSNIISGFNNQISSIQAQKTAAEEELKNVKITNFVSEAEMNLVEENNIDLTEKLENGDPRYIFAPGKQDNKYHIYDMKQNATLARLYADGQGFDIVESGNGYINNFKKTGDCQGETVFYMDSCDSVGQFNACYCTSSPLAFDLDGDGVKTSTDVVDFDIDGDGIMDKINNSADAVLVFDKDGDGISGKDGSECFGDNTDLDGDGVKDGFKDGFAALKSLASQYGLIDGKEDNVLDSNDISFLEKEVGFKIKAGGYDSEAQSLLDLGITEINLAQTEETTLTDNFDGMGNQLMQQEGATFTVNGETREYADIWHKKLDEELENAKNVFGGDSLSLNLGNSLSKLSSFSRMQSTSEAQEALFLKQQVEQELRNLKDSIAFDKNIEE